MPSLKRFLLENHCYHTISTTRDRAPIFNDQHAARIVVECLNVVGEEKAFILAYALMPDHLHLVVVPREPFSLPQVMQSIKGYSSRMINERLGRRGPGWARSYYDRVVRSEHHLTQTIEYVHHNPVAAGLVTQAEEYRFSSAYPEAATGMSEWLGSAVTFRPPGK